jgi:hypothetical protein
MSKSQMKITLITSFDIKGTVQYDFIPHAQTVNQAHFMEILKSLLEAVRRKRPELWTNDWILHHDIAPAQGALCQWPKNRLLKGKTHHISLILFRMASGCFKKIKSALKGRRFQDTEDIQIHTHTHTHTYI